MPLIEHSTIHGVLNLELRDEFGALVEARRVRNLITSNGKALLARLLGGKLSGAVLPVIGVGEGTLAASPGDAALGKKLSEARAEMSEPQLQGDGVRVVVSANIVDGGDANRPLPLTEAGILVRVGNDPVGVLFNRVTFPVINKGQNMTLLLSWELTF